MANLVISYDLYAPGKDYSRLYQAIESLRPQGVLRIHKSVWYASTDLSAERVRDYLAQFIDSNDSLFVVDATHDLAAWHHVANGSAIKAYWERSARR